jgi:hypothetical protein
MLRRRRTTNGSREVVGGLLADSGYWNHPSTGRCAGTGGIAEGLYLRTLQRASVLNSRRIVTRRRSHLANFLGDESPRLGGDSLKAFVR